MAITKTKLACYTGSISGSDVHEDLEALDAWKGSIAGVRAGNVQAEFIIYASSSRTIRVFTRRSTRNEDDEESDPIWSEHTPGGFTAAAAPSGVGSSYAFTLKEYTNRVVVWSSDAATVTIDCQ